jgi:hypothetical protein
VGVGVEVGAYLAQNPPERGRWITNSFRWRRRLQLGNMVAMGWMDEHCTVVARHQHEMSIHTAGSKTEIHDIRYTIYDTGYRIQDTRIHEGMLQSARGLHVASNGIDVHRDSAELSLLPSTELRAKA